jgi:hypothetical protein
MSSKPKVVELQAAPAQPTSEETRAEDLFNKQKAYFASDATKSYEWRVDQLNRLTRRGRGDHSRRRRLLFPERSDGRDYRDPRGSCRTAASIPTFWHTASMANTPNQSNGLFQSRS